MNDKQRIWLFNTELNYIKDDGIRKFAEEVLKNADDYFFSVPASSSGKYHPSFSLGEMGLVRHTKAVVYFLIELMKSKMFEISEREEDLLIVASISHDIKKQGDGHTSHTVKNHPQLASEFVRSIFDKLKTKSGIKKKDCDYICNAIETHMGIWGERAPKSDSEKIVHIADLIASRREIDLKFGQEELIMDYYEDEKPKETKSQIVEEKSDKSPKKVTIKNYICTFGKHKGKKLDEIPEDYMQWAIDNDINQSEFIEMAKKYLKKKK